MLPDKRVLFIGGTPRGRKVFEFLLQERVNVVGAYVLQEDEHEEVRESDTIAKISADHAVEANITKRLTPEHARRIAELSPDLMIVVGWRTIISAAISELAPLGCVLVHDSPLPRYRGFAPVNWAIINGERRWGVTLMHIAPEVDSGDIISQVMFDVARRATAKALYEQVVEATVQVIRHNLRALLDATAPRMPQNEAEATYACARTPEDGRIDWLAPTEVIDRLVRGLSAPYPGAHTTWKGSKLFVWEAEPLDPSPRYDGRIPKRVVGLSPGYADVLTGDGVLRLLTVQIEGDAPRPAGEVIRSVKASLG